MQTQPPPPTEEQPPPRPTRGQRIARMARRTARISAWGALGLLVFVLLAAVGLWYWSAGDQSLNTTLQMVERYMPAGSRLQAHGVRGTLRQGGHIDQLVYTQSGSQGPDSGALTLTLDNVDLQWDWTALRDRATRLRHLHTQRVTLADTRVADPNKAKEAFTSLTLPVGVDAPFVIDVLDIVSKSGQTTTLAQLQGRYTYHRTTARHALKIDKAVWNQGTYHIDVALDGKTPMALDAQGGGVLAIAASGERPAQTLHMQVQAQGTLAEPEGELDVRAQVRPASATNGADAASATRAELQATVQPWRSQPIAQAKAQWQQVNLQDFVPSLPRTQLQGQLAVLPIAGAAPATTGTPTPGMLGFIGPGRWQIALQAENALSGPWDKHLLPLHTLQSALRYEHGALTVSSLLWQASPQGGRVAGSGQYQPEHGWQGLLDVQALDPAALHSALAAAPLHGVIQAQSPALTAHSAGEAPVDFSVQLQSKKTSAAARSPQLAFEVIDVAGRFHQQTITVPTLRVGMHDAALQGKGSYGLDSQAAQADLHLTLPGAKALLQGSMAPASGQGQLQAQVLDLQKTSQWLQQWPGMATLRQQHLTGAARLDATWRGGWQNSGQGMQVNARLNAPAITVRAAAPANAPPTVIQQTLLGVQGTLADARISAESRVQQGNRALQLALQGRGGKRANGWQAQLHTTQLQLHDTLQNQRWQAALAAPATITLAQSGTTLRATTSALHIDLSGAQPGRARLLAEPITWVQQGGNSTLSSKGQLVDVPLAWADALSGNGLRGNGLAGDMVLGGHWDVQLGNTLRVQATVQRTSGDLVVLGDGAGQSARVQAGIRTARVDVQGSGNQLQAHLVWDSANAGTANATLATRLARSGSGWGLPASAPLQGRLQARLPRVGVWNLFAPPGWRLRGTLDADVALGGTVQAPLLNGTLNADDLGVRSVVDGFAFSNGRLRTRLTGQRLEIDEFSLQGSPAQVGLFDGGRIAGGKATITGNVAWGAPGQPLLQSLQTQLNAKLDRLQLSSLPERMLVLSGDIRASLANLQLVVRGGLVVNRALIDLPSGSAPKLGSDVVVRPSQKHPRAVLAQTNPPPAAAATPGPALDNDVVVKAAVPTPAASAPGAAGVASKPPAHPNRTSRAPAGKADPAAPAPALGVQKANPAIVPDIDVRIDLGEDFRVRGMGLDTWLGGQLTVQNGATLTALPRLTGAITTNRGTFRAYGQDLQIERGRIRFTGSLDNPSIDVIAIRPNLEVTVGVQIRGTAQQPLVQLFSDPAMPDAERLSWLVLGRSSNGVADAALLQQAAVALLDGSGRGITGELADVLGLDQVGFQGGDSVSSSSISLGKRFSKNFYVAYEKGLDATVGSLSFFYDISRRLKLRGQTGQQSAVDLIYTVTYD